MFEVLQCQQERRGDPEGSIADPGKLQEMVKEMVDNAINRALINQSSVLSNMLTVLKYQI